MDKFERLFGIKEKEIKRNCIIMPFLPRHILQELNIDTFKKGKVYKTGNNKDFTLINTGLGPALCGDAVLYLENTKCENIILFGSCGLVEEKRDIVIGTLVSPSLSYSAESFSDMLLGYKKMRRTFTGNKPLLNKFLNSLDIRHVKEVTCATLGSLKLEENCLEFLKKRNIDIVDMECSAFFSASRYIKRKAIALFYVSDIINKRPFYDDPASEEKLRIYSSINNASKVLCNFIKNNLNS